MIGLQKNNTEQKIRQEGDESLFSDLFRPQPKGRGTLLPILREIVENEYGQCAIL